MASRKRENAQRPPKAGAGARNAASLLGAADERHGGALLGRGRVIEVQRARILTAMTQVACERGAQNATVAHVVERCGVSRRTFYELFNDRDDCMLAAFDDAVARIAARVVPVWEGDGRWQERMRGALVELLVFCEEQPLLARVVFVESFAGGARLAARRIEVQERAIAAVDEGRKLASKGPAAPERLSAEGIVGALTSVLAARLSSAGSHNGKPVALMSLTGGLMSMIVLPYLGAAAAGREAKRPAPKRAVSAGAPDRRDGAIELRDAGMRLTYRTLRVLLAVADHPEGSNRQVGDAAGMTDQGQISKLLARLARIGLIENTFVHPGKGAPNSWALTEKGRRIAEAMREQTGEDAE